MTAHHGFMYINVGVSFTTIIVGTMLAGWWRAALIILPNMKKMIEGVNLFMVTGSNIIHHCLANQKKSQPTVKKLIFPTQH